MIVSRFLVVLACLICGVGQLAAQPLNPPIQGTAYRNTFGQFPENSLPGDRLWADFLARQTQAVHRQSMAEFRDRATWETERPRLKRELLEMLSLDPMPDRTPLKATVTGVIEHQDFLVEKLHFQSRPGLYATANVYVPKNPKEKLPAILYVCGHGKVKIDDVSYGNKTSYQHHGAWFARNGYVCLILDSVQLGEIEGIHHGTHHEGMWWWNSRGYTSAGAEAWNCIRALDYLQSRSDVDGEKLGVTGRSGGGAYSWWIAAIDDRIRVACPVAGITDLQNHVIDGCVEGHCDCMYMVNTYGWDYAKVAAMVAPRPLLICNTDKDRIFPLDGIVRLHADVRTIYDHYDVPDALGLLVTEGPHKDTQELQLPVMRWFNRWLKNSEAPVANFAEKLFTPQQLKVFDQLPRDEITSRCYEDFTRLALDTKTVDGDAILEQLRQKTFGSWPNEFNPAQPELLAEQEDSGVKLSVYTLEARTGLPVRMYLARPAAQSALTLNLEIVDEAAWQKQLQLGQIGFSTALHDELTAAKIDVSKPQADELAKRHQKWMAQIRERRVAYATLTPCGVGMTAFSQDEKYLTHLRRRMMLVGTTLASMQAWDMQCASQALQRLPGMSDLPLHFHASPSMTEVACFAALFEPKLQSISLAHAPRNDKESPDFLNWSRIVTPQQLVTLLSQKTTVNIKPAKEK